MSSKLVDTLIKENQGVVYEAKIYNADAYHYAEYYKNGELIETRDFGNKGLDQIRAAVGGWINSIKVLNS